ncbi:hypothetical protein HDU85_005270 [Gaertneriomyces sp. JEL0708]|nr:hypothetical protein HDU85_005270 [Gaertneriomyces sp. JEL0708]
MATKHLSPTSVPRHITPLRTTPLPTPRVLSSLQSFLASPPNLAPDVIYQLHEFQKSVDWQVTNHVESVKAEGMSMEDLDFGVAIQPTTKKLKKQKVDVGESSQPSEGREKAKKKKEGKDGKKKGSKWN